MEDEDKTQKNNDKFRKAQALVVEHLNLNPQDEDATKIFNLWKRNLDIYLETPEANDGEKFNVVINRLGLNTYEYVVSINTYTEAIEKLEKVYNKKGQ